MPPFEEPPVKEFQDEFRFLSNFWPAPVEFEGYMYPTVEHAYQAAKHLDPETRREIRLAHTPGQAKRLGGKPTRPDWNEVNIKIMFDLNLKKYQNYLNLERRLLATGDRLLQEGNKWKDTFWGVDLRTGKGENNLGKILMEIRDLLKGKQHAAI